MTATVESRQSYQPEEGRSPTMKPIKVFTGQILQMSLGDDGQSWRWSQEANGAYQIPGINLKEYADNGLTVSEVNITHPTNVEINETWIIQNGTGGASAALQKFNKNPDKPYITLCGIPVLWSNGEYFPAAKGPEIIENLSRVILPDQNLHIAGINEIVTRRVN
jgi:hypothetical protein